MAGLTGLEDIRQSWHNWPMKNRDNQAYREALGELIKSLDYANSRLLEARDARKAGSLTVPPDELRAQERRWDDTAKQLRQLTAEMFAAL